jgi:hypothetical protein
MGGTSLTRTQLVRDEANGAGVVVSGDWITVSGCDGRHEASARRTLLRVRRGP